VFTTSGGHAVGGTQLPLQTHRATLVRADLAGADRGAAIQVVSTVVGNGPATLAVSSAAGVLEHMALDLNGYQTISVPVTLPATTGTLTVTLTDQAGGQDAWALDVTRLVPDRTPPQVTLSQPTGVYTTTSMAPVMVTGTASDTAGLERVTVNGMGADLDPVTGRYSATLLLPPGTHAIQAVAQDRGGNQATSAAVSARVTWVAPSLEVPELLSGGEAQGTISITLTLDTPSILSGTLRLHTSGGTATAGQDYEPLDTTLTIRPYQTEVVVPLRVRDDSQVEGDERITLLLSDPVNLQLPRTTAIVVITDDDSIARHTIFIPLVRR
jgi:hypothetical protein